MLRFLPILLLACAALWTAGVARVAQAQPAPPAAEALMQRWGADLRAALDAAERVRYTEVEERHLEGPTGARRWRTVSEVVLVGGRPQRRRLAGTADGTELGPEKLGALDERLHRALGPDYVRAERAAALPLRALSRLQPEGPAVADVLDGTAAWRLELRPRPRDPNRQRDHAHAPPGHGHAPHGYGPSVEHATLWLSRGPSPTLLRAHLRVRTEAPEAAVLVVTDYRGVRGPAGVLPVPHRQRVEGTLVQQRRWRTFTVLLHAERAVEDVRVTWRTAETATRGRR